MRILIAFGVFVAATLAAIITGTSIMIALIIGFISFFLLGLNMGHSAKSLLEMGMSGVRESAVTLKVMCVIGFITAIWRVSGTITTFAYYGMKFITPPLFLLIAFFLSCLLSYALGTSFGVAGTIGVIFMALARTGGVDPVITAGVIMSGIYFGDRCSPVSSSANMVASVTETKIYSNVSLMMRTSLVAVGITVVIYTVLSIMNPLKQIDPMISAYFEKEFSLSLLTFLPAVVMLALPFFKVDIVKAMLLSTLTGIIIAWQVEGVSLLEIMKAGVFGFTTSEDGLGSILNGGGLVSMLEVIGILAVAGAYSGLFSGTGMLNEIQSKLMLVCEKRSRYFVTFFVSIIMSILFSIQAIVVLLCVDLLKKPYLETGGTREELAIDIENSAILFSCMIPWGIGCYVPLAFMGAGFDSIPYAVYMYILPISYFFVKNRWFGESKGEAQLSDSL